MPKLHTTKILGDLRVTGLTNLHEVGAYTLTEQMTSTVATGIAPFVITSTTRVDNLNADLLDGNHASAFYLASNPSGYTTNDGTVTSITAGNGMNFTTITGTGAVTMGTPSSLTEATTNSVSGTTHTHAITNYALSGTVNQITVSGSPKVLGSTTTLSLPQNIHTGAKPTFAGATLGNIRVGITGANEIDTKSGNLTLDSTGGTTTIDDNLVVTGNLTINGSTTTINATTITVDDKNIELGSIASPTNATADGGGITLRGTTNKTITWSNATSAWESSEKLVAKESIALKGTTGSGTMKYNETTKSIEFIFT